MKNLLLWLLLLLLLLWTAIGAYWYSRTCCGCCQSVQSAMTIMDGNAQVARSPDNVRFAMNANEAMLSPDVKKSYQAVADYLKKYPSKTFVITGQYMEGETAPEGYADRGLARADGIKGYLMTLGINPSQLKTASQKVGSLTKDGDVVVGGLDYSFENEVAMPDSATVASQLAKPDTTTSKNTAPPLAVAPIVLYFATNANAIELTSQQRQQFIDMIAYLRKVPGSKIYVSGHTDNVGNSAANQALSLKRAEFAKAFLLKKGLPASRLVVEGLGDKQPVADNSTEEGRAKNRRTEISVK